MIAAIADFTEQAASNRGLSVAAFQEWLDANGLAVVPCLCHEQPPLCRFCDGEGYFQGVACPSCEGGGREPGHLCRGWKVDFRRDG